MFIVFVGLRLDELSGMTYLSYFMKPGGPGYNATMRWVNSQVKNEVNNFTVSFFRQILSTLQYFTLQFIVFDSRLIGMMAAFFVK